MHTRTSVSTALRQAQELIEHAERNNEEPDCVWLAQLGRAYASSVRAEMSNQFRLYVMHVERGEADCERLSRAIGRFGIRLSESEAKAAAMVEALEAVDVEPVEDEESVSDSFTPDQHRSFLARCLKRLQPGSQNGE